VELQHHDDFGTMGWEHGTLTFDSNGLGNMADIVRSGNPSGIEVTFPTPCRCPGCS